MPVCRHGFSHDTNDLHNAHVTAVLSKITSDFRNAGWNLRRMSHPELCLMSTLIDEYSDAERRVVLDAWHPSSSGSSYNEREDILARTVTAPLAALLLSSGFSEWTVTESVRRCIPNKHFYVAVEKAPVSCDDTTAGLPHIHSQRGALIHHFITDGWGDIPDSSHLMWLGERYESIIPLLKQLIERGSSNKELITGMMEAGTPLASGAL